MKTTLSLVTSLSLIAFASTLMAETSVGRFDAGTMYQPPQEQTAAETSRYSVRTIEVAAGRNQVALPVTGGSGLILWMIPLSVDTELSSSLTTPGGQRIRAEEKRQSGMQRVQFGGDDLGLDLPVAGRHEVLHVAQAAGGRYQLDIESSRAGALTLICAEPDSALQLVTWASPMSRTEGSPLSLFARLSDSDAALTGAQLTARVASPASKTSEPVQLFDDGAHNDGAANDGLYAVTLDELPSADAGFWNVRFEATGRNPEGGEFARTGGTAFMNEPQGARLTTRAVKAEMVSEAGNRVLRVTAPATARVEGRYRFDVLVAGAANASGERRSLAWSESIEQLVTGRNQLTVDIPAGLLGDESSLLVDVRLLGLDVIGLAGRTVLELSR